MSSPEVGASEIRGEPKESGIPEPKRRKCFGEEGNYLCRVLQRFRVC